MTAKTFSNYLAKIFLASLVVLVVLNWPKTNQSLIIHFFDVGQGDSVLIVMPDQQTVLIDGGPDFSLMSQLDAALPLTHRKIDLLILTHLHDDHLIGLLQVVKNYQVSEVLLSGVLGTSQASHDFQALVVAKQIPVTIAKAGLVWQFALPAQKAGWPWTSWFNHSPPTLTVVYPLEDVSKKIFDDLNASSVVVQLIYQNSRALFMGDLPAAQEAELMAINHDLRAQVLKVSHHGSKYSSSWKFLQAVKPMISVISCGLHNLFHHPAPTTVALLKAVGSQVFITVEDGSISLKTYGNGYWQKIKPSL